MKAIVVYDPTPDENGQVYIWHSCIVTDTEINITGGLQGLITALKAYWAVNPDDPDPPMITQAMKAVLYPKNGTVHSPLGHTLAALRYHLEREVIIVEGFVPGSDIYTVVAGEVVEKSTEEYEAQELRREIDRTRKDLLDAITRKAIVDSNDGDLAPLSAELDARVTELKAKLAELEGT